MKGIIMKKKFRTFFVACMAMLLSGCFKVRIVMDVHNDATATGSYSVLMTEQLLTTGGSTVEDALATQVEEVKKEYPDATVEIIREGEGENAYAGYKVSAIPIKDASITKDGNKITVEIPMNSVQNSIEEEAGLGNSGSIEALKQAGAESTLTINMPGNATANIGTVSGKTVTVDLLQNYDTDKLIVTCSTGLTPWLIVVIGAAVLAVVAAVLIVTNKKKKA